MTENVRLRRSAISKKRQLPYQCHKQNICYAVV